MFKLASDVNSNISSLLMVASYMRARVPTLTKGKKLSGCEAKQVGMNKNATLERAVPSTLKNKSWPSAVQV